MSLAKVVWSMPIVMFTLAAYSAIAVEHQTTWHEYMVVALLMSILVEVKK